MSWAIVRKEVAEHWVPAVALGLLLGALFSVLGLGAFRDGLPPFTVLQQYLWFAGPLAAWVVTGRLVRREYVGRTQLFLEAMPVSRLRVLSTKYVLGVVAMIALTAPAYGVCAVASVHGHTVTAGLLAIIATRTVVFLAFLHAVCFLLALLGRYRVAIVVVSAFALLGVASVSDLELGKAAPLALLDGTFPFERHDFPVEDLLWTLGVTAALTAFAASLAVVREGSVAARLAHAMSNREKAAVAAIAIGAIFAAFIWDESRTKDPYDPPTVVTHTGQGVRVAIGAGSDLSFDQASNLADSLHTRLADMREYLGIETLEPVFLFTRPRLDADRYELGELTDEEGVVVRVNPTAEGWSDDDFLAWLAQVCVGEHTEWRVSHEPRLWVQEGFGPFWAYTPGTDAAFGDNETLLLRALYGTPDGVTAEHLRDWLTVKERVGDVISQAVGWSGLRVFGRRYGREALRGFLGDALGRKTPKDIRALWHENSTPIRDLVERHSGASYGAFLRVWNEDLDAERARLADALAAMPRLSVEIDVENVTAAIREVVYTARSSAPVPEDTRAQFQWIELSPFDLPVEEHELESHDVAFSAAAAGRRLPESFPRGSLVGWRFVVWLEALNCYVGTGLTRVELR